MLGWFKRYPMVDFPKPRVEFAPWRTEVEGDELTFVSVCHGGSALVTYPQEGFGLRVDTDSDETFALEARFLSKEKRALVTFGFAYVSAFRVLDEHGLGELWEAARKDRTGTLSTFRVRGHKWQYESELSWLTLGDEHDYSFLVSTGFQCLEVVAPKEPLIQLKPATVESLDVIPTPPPS